MKRGSVSISIAVGLLLLGIAGETAAYENKECLACHGDRKLFQVLETGKLRSIYVDPDLWDKDVHNKKGLKCVDCHQQASIQFHPRNRLVQADCSRCHPESTEDFHATIHVQKAGLTDARLPRCYDCHTSHAVRTKEDPKSSIEIDRTKQTCDRCHPEIMAKGVLNHLATFRISGHRKEDSSKSFDLRRCILCHQEDSIHGRARLYNGSCNECHRPRVRSAMLGIHLIPSLKVQPLTFALKYLDGILLLGILVAIAGGVGIRQRRKLLSLPKKERK